MKLAFGVYGLFALTFSYFQVNGDALVYFNLQRRFFGEEPDFAYAYQFGSALWNTPFFLVGKAFGIAFGFQPRIFHVSFEEISITFATNAAFVLTLYLGWCILRELELPRGPAVLFLTAFGTPLFYYVVFDPSEKHVVDTLVLTAAVYVFLQAGAATSLRAPLVLGVLAGWSMNIRWVNGALFFVLVCALLLRRRFTQAGVGACAALIVAPLILVLPALRGIPYAAPSYFPPEPGSIVTPNLSPEGWTAYNSGSVARGTGRARAGAAYVSVVATASGGGVYTIRRALTAGANATVSVYVKGTAGEVVRGSVESPAGTFLGYLGKRSLTLDGTWQRLSGEVRVGEGGTLQLAVTSQSGGQTFHLEAAKLVGGKKATRSSSAYHRRRVDSTLLASSVLPAGLPIARVPEQRSAVSPEDFQRTYDNPLKNFDPMIAPKMLASEHRGLFLWTPLTAFAVFGFILLLRRTYGSPVFSIFLAPLSLGSLALLSTHMIWTQWDGGFSFSQRFLTGLFPLYLIGISELVRRARFVAYPLLVLSVLFALSIAFVHNIGYDGISQRDGIARHVEAGWDNRRNMRLDVQDDAKARWAYLWGLLGGRDSKCINEPLGTTKC